MQSRIIRFQGFEGLSLTAEIWGDDDAWPVLLLHGGGQTRHAWGGTAEALAGAGWRAVSMRRTSSRRPPCPSALPRRC